MTHEFKLGKNPCPRCRRNGRDRRGDNFHWYGEGQGGSCFTCGYTIPSDAYKEQMGWTDSENDDEKELPVTREALTEEQKAEVKELTGTRGMGYRGIRDETSRFFGVRYEYDAETGQPVAQYFPTTIDSELVGYRIRRFPKDFSHSIGKVGKETDMLAEFRFKTHSKTCVIVGGETKILTTYQMLKDDLDRKGKSEWEVPAVIASTLGEPGAHKQVQARYEFFSKFDRVLICMDNDTAGKEAAEKIAAVLPRGKAYIMSMRYKDSDEYIMDRNGNPVGKEHEFIRDYWNARPWTPDGVKTASDAFTGIPEELSRERLTLPPYMHRLAALMGGGARQGRIGNIIADTSVGKTSHVRRMVYHWIMNSEVVPTICSLEDTAAQYVLDLISIHLGENLMWNKTEDEILQWLETEHGQRVKHEICFKEDGSPRFYIIDERSGNIKDIEAQMEVMLKKCGSKLFIIDVLSDLLRGSNEDKAEDHLNFQKGLVKEGVSIWNALHTRKPAQNKDGTVRKTSEYDALGTGSFVQSAAYNIVLTRDKLAEDPVVRDTTEVELAKCRGGKTGAAGKWYYHFPTAKCYDSDDWYAKNVKEY
jgi:archaellum biogenesis ATPase FlaH